MKILLTLLALSLFSFGAQAEVTGASAKIDGNPFGSLALIHEACVNPGAFNHQNAPTDIEIMCDVHEIIWRMGKPGTMSFPNIKILTVGLSSDKAGVLLGDADFDLNPGPVSFPCPTFVQAERDADMPFKVSCTDINSMHAAGKGLLDFCRDNMLNEIESDETLMVSKLTGKTATGCGFAGGHSQN